MTDYVPKRLSDISDAASEEFLRMYSSWFMAKKGVILGRVIGELMPAALIPACYSDAIKKAQEVASNA
jgi:putative ATP-dependent endonuclease of OLD family